MEPSQDSPLSKVLCLVGACAPTCANHVHAQHLLDENTQIYQEQPMLGNQLSAGLGGSKDHFSTEASVSLKCADSISLMAGWYQKHHTLELASLLAHLSTQSCCHLHSHIPDGILSDWRFQKGSQELEKMQESV